MSLHLGIYNGPTGVLLLDATARGATGIRASTTPRGFERLDATVPLSLEEAWQIWDGAIPWAVLRSNGAVIFEGRLADPELYVQSETGLVIRAYGAWDSLADLPYTALWSDTRVTSWHPVTTDEENARAPARYQFNQANQLLITPNKDALSDNGHVASFTMETPDGSTRGITNISFDYLATLPNTTWRARVVSWNRNYTGATVLWTSDGTSAAAPGITQLLTCTAAERLTLDLYYNSGVAATSGGESGQYFAVWSNLRVTTTPLLVDTIITVTAFSGDTSITVASTANITVGMILILQMPAPAPLAGERVQVGSIVGNVLTLSTGPLLYAYAAGGNTVRAQWVDAADIATDIISSVSTLNPAQLSSSTAGLDPTLALPDLSDQVYEDRDIGGILTQLAFLGDTSQRQLEVGVWEDRRLVLRQQGAAARQWFPTVVGLRARKASADMANSVYAVYEEASGRTLRTASATNAGSVAKQGFTRRRAVAADTTNATEAARTRDTMLADTATPLPQAEYEISDVQDGAGSIIPRWLPRACDTATMRAVPSGLGTTVDRLRTIRISRTDYDADADQLTLEPETPIPTLEAALAREEAGLNRPDLPVRVLSTVPVLIITRTKR